MLARSASRKAALRLYLFSMVYLASLFAVMVVDIKF
jgi:heme O synthase-like polyprenyltransferase